MPVADNLVVQPAHRFVVHSRDAAVEVPPIVAVYGVPVHLAEEAVRCRHLLLTQVLGVVRILPLPPDLRTAAPPSRGQKCRRPSCLPSLTPRRSGPVARYLGRRLQLSRHSLTLLPIASCNLKDTVRSDASGGPIFKIALLAFVSGLRLLRL